MKKKKVSRLWFAFSLLFALLALSLIFLPSGSTLLLFPKGQPEETADAFFAALESGDYNAASAYCYPSLPADDYPEEEDAAMLYDALRESWSWSGAQQAVKKGNTATLTGQFRCLNLSALSEGLNEDVNTALAERVADARLGSEVFNDDGSYRDEVVSEVWQSVLSERLEDTETYCATQELTVKLVYRNGAWMVQADEELLEVLSGGRA